jgi:alkylated DNA nucleotide flippase Atl1
MQPARQSSGHSGESTFAENVLDIVGQIPPGRVMTYGDIAATLGSRGARLVGQVMSRYGSDLPWWRVIRAGGHPPLCHDERALAYYRAEGTPLIPSTTTDAYRVDYASARWSPA